jgi:hypothetical protein
MASPGGFEFQSTAGINQISIESLSANITQGNSPENRIATHHFSATASNGSVTLDNTNNSAQAVSGTAQNNFLYTDADSFEVQGITAGNDVTISAETGSIPQATGSSNAIRSSRTNATANNGSVTLGNTDNNAQAVSGTAQNNFLYTDADSFEVRGITAGNDVTISAETGSITQATGSSNAIRSSRTNATASNGSVTLDNTDNNAQAVSGTAQNNFLYTDADSGQDSGMVILAGRDLIFSTAPSLASGQIGTNPLTPNAEYRQIVLSKNLAENFYDGGKGAGNILSTEFVVGVPTLLKKPSIDTHQQQRVALDFGNKLAVDERGFDVIISYFDGKTQRFANATEQGTTYQLPYSDPSHPSIPLNPLPLKTDDRISIPSTEIASGIADSQFRNNVVFQRTEPLTINRFDMMRMLTPANTLATNAVVRRSADFFLFENVNSAFTDSSGLRDITFASAYIDNVKPYAEAFSGMEENPPMQMPQILDGEMMELEERLPMVRQDKSSIEIKAAQRTVEVAVYDIGYVDTDTSTNASNGDRPDESQVGNAVNEQQPLLKFVTYRVKEDDLVDAIRIETLRRIVQLVEGNESDSLVNKLRLGGGFAVVEFVNGAPEDILGEPFLITKEEIDTELDKGTQP